MTGGVANLADIEALEAEAPWRSACPRTRSGT